MNEPRYPMDDKLNQFEQELKSLSPRSLVSLTRVQNEFSMQASAPIAQATSSVGTPALEYQTRSSDRSWIKTVVLAWSSGLAAGLLLSWGWNVWSASPSGLAHSNLSDSTYSSPLIHDALPDEVVTQNLTSGSLMQPGALDQRETTSWLYVDQLVSFDTKKDSILRPLMPLESLVWELRQLPSLKPTENKNRYAAAYGFEANPEVSSDKSSNNNLTAPTQLPGQRQLLKSMFDSGSLSSI